MIDIHSHILPCVDDGSQSWEVTLEMCRQSIADGVTHIVATPHANCKYVYHRESDLVLLAELRSKVPDLQFSMGCEIQLSTLSVQDALQNPDRYTFNNSRYLLVEFNSITPAIRMQDPIHLLLNAGFLPIVTHPERNAVMVRKPDLVKWMVKVGCLVQVTSSALTGFWGREAKRMASALVKEGLASILATDAHNAKARSPILSAGVKVASGLIGEAEAMKLVWDNVQPLVE